MPRFFFHNRIQDQTYLDPDGTDLLDFAAAVDEAVLSARDMMADELRHGAMVPGRNFDIAGEDGLVLVTVAFHDCLYQGP